MPRITYTPEGREDNPLVFDFEFDTVMSPECIAIEDLTRRNWDDIPTAFFSGNMRVIHALLYVLMKRSHPTMRPDELEFSPREVVRDVTDAESRRLLEALESMDQSEWTAEQRAAAKEVRARVLAPPEADEADPKG
jgi:hypothetical protein